MDGLLSEFYDTSVSLVVRCSVFIVFSYFSAFPMKRTVYVD